VSEIFLIGEYLAKLQVRAHLAYTLLKDEESARDNHVFPVKKSKSVKI